MLLCTFLTACDNGGNTNPTPTPTPTPTSTATATPKAALIKNGGFEETYETTYPKTPKTWSSLGDSFGGKSASLSDSKYGVISTEETSFDENNQDKYGNIENPGTPGGDDDTDKNILMIYNQKPSAVKYKSQSISLPANSYALISLYVKTLDIIPGDANNSDFYGATINFSGMDEPVYINGINTAQQWKKYEFFFEGSATSAKTLYIELGLGTGSDADSRGYTSGHVFFDQVKMEYINRAQYETALLGTGDKEAIVELNGGSPVYSSDTDRFFYFDNNKYNTNAYYVNRINTKDLTDNELRFAYSYKNRLNITDYGCNIIDQPLEVQGDYYGGITPIVPNGQIIDAKNYQDNLEDFPFLTDELKNYPFTNTDVFVMSNNKYGTQGYKTPDFTINPYEPAAVNDIYLSYTYYRIGVWVKTSNFVTNGLNVYLVKDVSDGEGGYIEELRLTSIFSDINTGKNNLSEEDFEKDENLHNKWSNWKEYVFYVKASPYETVNVHLEFWLGPKNVSGKQDYNLTKGYCLIGGITNQKLNSTEYSSASSGDTIKKNVDLQLSDKFTSAPNATIANCGFNISSETAIMQKPINPTSWTPYFGGYSKLLGNDVSTLPEYHGTNAVTAGIINRNYLDAYRENGYIDNTVTSANIQTGDNVGHPNYLMIRNRQTTSYGFVSSELTLSAKTNYVFSVYTRTYGDARAAIYLTDEDGKVIELSKDDNTTYANYEKQEANGWTKYTFYIKLGELSKKVKLELFNGTRDGSAAGNSIGYVLFDDAYMATVTDTVFDGVEADNITVKKLSFEDETAPTESPTATPSPTQSPVPGTTAAPFDWGLLSMLLLSVTLLFVLLMILIRKTKESRLFKRRRVKAEIPSYSRDKLKLSKKKVSEETGEDSEEESFMDDNEESDENDNDR
jgi:hypothetical protein